MCNSFLCFPLNQFTEVILGTTLCPFEHTDDVHYFCDMAISVLVLYKLQEARVVSHPAAGKLLTHAGSWLQCGKALIELSLKARNGNTSIASLSQNQRLRGQNRNQMSPCLLSCWSCCHNLKLSQSNRLLAQARFWSNICFAFMVFYTKTRISLW